MEKYNELIRLDIISIYNLDDANLKKLQQIICDGNYNLFILLPMFLKVDAKSINEYTYLEYSEPIYYYYKFNLFFNEKKQILIESEQTIRTFNVLLDKLTHLLKLIKDSQISFTIFNEHKYLIAINRFNELYGHAVDEIFNLANVLELFKNNNITHYIPLFIYPDDNYYKNIHSIIEILFDNIVNPEYNNSMLIKIEKLIMIEHHYNLDTFHLFPKNITNKIVSYYDKDCNTQHNKICLIREKQTWINNDINNKSDIQTLCIKKGFTIINPELISIQLLISYLKNADTIIITFGSALVNLIFTKINAKIIILKSNSYKSHGIDIFRNLIKNYGIKYDILECDNINNDIDINLLSKCI
jgi:hypothetical protein